MDHEKYIRKPLLIIGITVAAITVLYLYIVFGINASDSALAGQFGDMFGGLNAIFSGAAFVAITITIFLQRKEFDLQKDALEIQKKELEETRYVLIGQQRQLELQSKTLKKQQFDNTFFELLKLRNNIVERIAYGNFKDQSAIWYLCRHIEEKITPPFKTLATEYNALNYNIYHAPMSNYYRTIYSILEFIEKSDIEHDEKDFYAGLLRSLFSIEELILLALNCISSDGAKNMMPLMVKYNIFKHIPLSKLITDEFIAVLVPAKNSD